MMTPRKLRFVEEYVVDPNATQAAIRSGYSKRTAKSQGSRLLTDVDVAALIKNRQNAAAFKAGITKERIIEELKYLGLSTMDDYVHINEAGEIYLDFSHLPESGLRAVQEIVQGEYVTGKGDDARDVKSTKFKLHGKVKALELLMRNLGMLQDKVEHDVTVHHVIDLGFGETPPKDVTPPSPLIEKVEPA